MDLSKNVETLGQVFTPEFMVDRMLSMRRNRGRCLEPSCGDGMFFNKIPGCTGIEIDERFCPDGAICMDFFDYPVSEKFDTIIGNPPYVAYKEVLDDTKKKLDTNTFSEKTNLYVFFMMKCLDHLNDGGEMIFITPREFMKSTSSIPFNRRLYAEGTITNYFETGDSRVFNGFSPNCIVFRFEKGNFDRNVNGFEFTINDTGFL
ncbi:MAG: class I SAM-dependent methyltransferase, partial [Bacteroidales bacterium]|nr:class I SAM-dependent methyltransferase [Bacteroidales bacterium]